MRFVLGIDIGGTNLVVGSVAEDGSALHAIDSEPTQAEAGQRDVLDRLIALAQRTIEQRFRALRSSASEWEPRDRWTPRAGSCCSRPISDG